MRAKGKDLQARRQKEAQEVPINKHTKKRGTGKEETRVLDRGSAAGTGHGGGIRPPQPRNSAATMGGLGACPGLCGGRARFGVISVVNTF